MDRHINNASECSVCKEPGHHLCGKCLIARYCSREHQKLHWKHHKNNCFPCKVETNSLLGRHLVLSRDVKAGDTLIVDGPLVVGPLWDLHKLSCLGCNELLERNYDECVDCGFPLCSPNCPNKINHQRECRMIFKTRKKANVTTPSNPFYRCVTPLRCLWLRENSPEKWKQFVKLESHLDHRRGTERYKEVQNFVVFTIRTFFKMVEFSEEEIHQTCGILDTNGFEIPGLNLVAVYAFGSLLEHKCTPNTMRTFDDGVNLLVTASINLNAGEHVTTSYVDPFWGSRVRSAFLSEFKHFKCLCDRCRDPTDLGTHLSSLVCESCKSGLVSPPTEVMSAWKCNSCLSAVDSAEMEKKITGIFRQKERLTMKVSSHEKFLKMTRSELSENHQFRLEVKLRLLQLYGREQQTGFKGCEDFISRRRDLCKEVLGMANIFSPGAVC